jgi:gliding motility-associated-like protein
MTKKIILLAISILSIINKLFCQNLVPNPGFEQYSVCPYLSGAPSGVDVAYPWFIPTSGSTDYMNVCDTLANGAPDFYGVPLQYDFTTNSAWGYQQTRTSCNNKGYAGFFAMVDYGSIGFPWDYREYSEVKLISPLIVGKTYSVKFYVNLWNKSQWAVDRLGVRFSVDTLKCNTSSGSLIKVNPHVMSPPGAGNVLKDTLNWMLVSGDFTADSAYNFITIGNFLNDLSSLLQKQYEGNPIESGAYYYLDDVSVIPSDISSNGSMGVSSSDSLICLGQYTSLLGYGGAKYLWSNGATTASVNVNPIIPTTYTVTITDNCNEVFISSVHISIDSCKIDVPNVFTPNNDGKNDFFFIPNVGYSKLTCAIYNRWGNKIYEWNDPNGWWDGRNESGENSDNGVYYFIVRAEKISGGSFQQTGYMNLFSNSER